MNKSLEKINSQISYHLSFYFQKEFPNIICSVVNVDTYADLSVSNIFISELEDDDSFINILNDESKTIRYSIAKKLNIRKMPELRFILDHTETNYAKINELLNNK